jgi:hypothetical protein
MCRARHDLRPRRTPRAQPGCHDVTRAVRDTWLSRRESCRAGVGNHPRRDNQVLRTWRPTRMGRAGRGECRGPEHSLREPRGPPRSQFSIPQVGTMFHQTRWTTRHGHRGSSFPDHSARFQQTCIQRTAPTIPGVGEMVKRTSTTR